MKNIILIAFLGLFTTAAFSQIEVVSSGKVHVGTIGTTPISEMHLTGDLTVTPKTGILGVMRGGTVDQRFTLWNGGNSNANAATYITMNGTTSNSNFVFAGDRIDFKSGKGIGDFGTNAMRIHSGGEVSIGNNVTPNWTFHVDGTAGKTGGGEFETVSDKRLKKNIKDYHLGLDEILKINPKTFKYIRDYGLNSTDTYVGVLAQEYQKIDPLGVKKVHMIEKEEIIKKSTNGMDPISQSRIVKEGDFLSVDGSAIKYMLVNAIKEQQAMIDEQNRLINEQNRKYSELEDKIKQLIDNPTNSKDVTLSGFKTAQLFQNSPNPFTGNTSISYEIPETVRSARISFMDLKGTLLKSVDIDERGQGKLEVDSIDLPTGTYIYSLHIDNRILDTKKMVLN